MASLEGLPGPVQKRTIRPMLNTRSHVCFAAMILLGILIYHSPIGDLGRIVFQNDTYSHIVLIPLVSAALLIIRRETIFAAVHGKPAVGLGVCAGGLFLYGIAMILGQQLSRQTFRNQDAPNDYLTLCMAALVAWVVGSFIAVYGTQAFKKARFALMFLMFSIPMPMFLQDGIITSLQYATAEATDLVFQASGVPYHRSGLVFEFSNITVEVAEQCSGIRSSLSFLIVSVLTGYLFLRTVSRRLILTVAVLPITVLKNALRIVAITLLANQVDPRILSDHWLHTSGGIPFFAVALTLLIPLVWMLRKSEFRGLA
jgi:exosortase